MIRILSCVLLIGLVPPLRAAEPEKSVIQIEVSIQEPDWQEPWKFQPLQRAGGSGFVIEGKRIMTNAHVVSRARQILVRRYQDPRPHRAVAKFIAHDCDLAILEVEDESFFDGLEPLQIGDLPKVRSVVVTYGYPAGGRQISYTSGVVSRIEMQQYVHIGNRSFLAVQTDAAINPGNSGGPVIQDGKVVGVAFQGVPGLENTGFFIPTAVIKHVLKDVSDGKYDGFPLAGLRLMPLENPAYRRALGLQNDDAGAKIDGVFPVETTRELIHPEDVLLQVGGDPVAIDGTVLYQGNRVHCAVAFQSVQAGESIPVKLWRDGAAVDIDLPMQVYEGDKLQSKEYDALPRYYIYGGMVFTPLTADYLGGFGRGGPDVADAPLVYELYYRQHEEPDEAREEPIVLATTLAHPVNANNRIRGNELVDSINGIRIEKLEDVVRAIETSNADEQVIEFLPHHSIECLNRQAAEQANPAILQTYGIQEDRRL